MAFPCNSLRAFLQHAKTNLFKAIHEEHNINIVVGNESADLDSLTSSLLYAYINSIAPPRNNFSPLYVPLLNIPSSGLRLRPEFTAVCEHANIPPDRLITLDDLPSQSMPLKSVRWILVDHNKLQGDLGYRYSSRVQGVIDHHEEENAVPENTDPEPRVIEKCGSCTSLVVRQCKTAWDCISSSSLSTGAAHGQGEVAMDDSAVTQVWDAQLAKMALASILVDTANLTAPGKVEQVDRDSVDYLEAKIQMSSKDARKWDRDSYYKELDEAKRDISSLSLTEVLIKDYKGWTESATNLGISSVVKPLEFLVQKADEEKISSFEDQLQRFMDERSLSIFAIMTTSTSPDGDFKRELLIEANSSASSSAIKFAEQGASEFQLEDVTIEGIPTPDQPGQHWRKTWLQKDVSKSRKQVAPLLRKAMKSTDG
ncbi:Exopolyphosphatase [Imshaugia aleurites]|uniref:Exopolyphosphatase n=1 Tax=Imshaugia aleurites TaxID=172621 RepID=A0A8H3FFK6_9LECA|nr:Exopolyphosphatase [Imshaugia aleurites]